MKHLASIFLLRRRFPPHLLDQLIEVLQMPQPNLQRIFIDLLDGH